MNFEIAMTGFVALYVFMLAGFAGWVIIGHVPAILHTPLMSGSNFVHGIVVVGSLYALLNATNGLEQTIGFFAVLLGAGNAAGEWNHRMGYGDGDVASTQVAFGELSFEELLALPVRDGDPPGRHAGRARAYAEFLWGTVHHSAAAVDAP